MPRSSDPSIRRGGRSPSAASILAPIARSGSATLPIGRRRIDSSPSRLKLDPCCPASQPEIRRISVPALPTSMSLPDFAPRKPTPSISTRSPLASSPVISVRAPSAATASRLLRVSAASR